IKAMKGLWIPNHGGGQIGTSAGLMRFPSKNMAIVFAANTEGADGLFYTKRLFELLTDEPWMIQLYAKDRAGQALYNGLRTVFNYGGAWFDRRREPFTNDPQELIKAFNYFNRAVNLSSLHSSYEKTLKAIDDGPHPVADSAFFKVGSFVAAKLREKYGVEREKI